MSLAVNVCLFSIYDTFSIPHYIALNDMMIGGIGKDLERSVCGLIEVLPLHLPRGSDNVKNLSRGSRCPRGDSNRRPPEYKSRPLLLHQHARLAVSVTHQCKYRASYVGCCAWRSTNSHRSSIRHNACRNSCPHKLGTPQEPEACDLHAPQCSLRRLRTPEEADNFITN
jgi:hypothetical protein